MSDVPLYRGTSLMRNSLPLGPYSRPVPRNLWWSWEGGLFRVSEVTLKVGRPLQGYLAHKKQPLPLGPP